MSSKPFVSINDLTKEFPMGETKVVALNKVTLEIQPKSFTVIMGPSGSGKSTLLYLIGGLDWPTSGSIRVAQDEVEKMDENSLALFRRNQVGFIFQSFNLVSSMPAEENVSFPLRFSGVSKTERKERSRKILQQVGLGDRISHRPTELSGGQQQRVAIARALAADPQMVICDEPISSLDVSVQGALMNLFVELQSEQGIAYVFISHDLSAVQHLSDWIAVMYVGHLMELGTAVSVLNPPYHPYTEALLSAVPIPDPNVTQARIRLRGNVPSAVDVPPGCRFHPRCPRCLGAICSEQEPPWAEVAEGHWIYCHIALDELLAMQSEVHYGAGVSSGDEASEVPA